MESLKCRNKFSGTLYNTYSFLPSMPTSIKFQYDASKALPLSLRSRLDQWIASLVCNRSLANTRMYMDDFEPTQAAR
ncbi:MAG: hypothetical protein IPI96_14845 [Saprospiraceae bacterium]|nr:hypothetical protein [Saprospiraceae bacterium]